MQLSKLKPAANNGFSAMLAEEHMLIVPFASAAVPD
jgi:hypothetical protein